METTNLGKDPKKDQGASDPVAKPENSSEISINFTPKVPITEKTADNTVPPTSATPLISLNVKKSDLEKAASLKPDSAPKADAPAPAKKGLLAGFFGKKDQAADSLKTKPSTAWGTAMDVSPEKKPLVPTASPATPDKPAPLKPELAKPEPAATDKKDFFTSSALQQKAGTSKLVENIATQKARLEEPKMEELLGKKSTILEQSIEQEAIYKMKKKLRVVQFMAFVVAVLAISVNGFLYYQLSPGVNVLGYLNYNFESNLRNDLFNLNENLRAVQTDLSKYQYLSGQLYLNQFGYESTRFLDSVTNLEEQVPASQRAEMESVVEEAKNHMPDLLAGAQANLSAPLAVETYPTRGEEVVDPALADITFQNNLKQAINTEKLALKASGSNGSGSLPTAELAFFDNTIKLVGNNKLLSNLNAYTVDAFTAEADLFANNNDPAQRLAFRTYIDNLLASTKVNLATITTLRNSRIKWSEVMSRLEMITNQVNTEHNSGLGAGNGSVITYSSYDFNSETGTISINAINTTRSSTNREVVTYLIEALEASPEFKNVSNRNFPLSKTLDAEGNTTYSLNFKISMELEKGAFSKLNSPIEDLNNGQQVAKLKVPVKRKQ